MDNNKSFYQRLVDNPWILASVLFFLLFIASLMFDLRSEARVFYAKLFNKDIALEEEIEAVPQDEYDVPISEIPRVEVSMDDDDVLGDENALITIVEFSDFECPYCGKYYTNTFEKIKENYIDTGIVKYVFRDYPLSFHENAGKAAEAAECAGDQDKYWDMHDMIFENQATLSRGSFEEWAGEIGLNQSQFNECLSSSKYKDEVANDITDAESYGVQATPAFFINGILITGAQDYSVFKEVIEAELAK